MFSLKKLKTLKLADILQPKIVRFVWSAILDEKVCALCRSLDGKIMDSESSEYSIYKSPVHPNCRCTQIPITSDAENIPEPNFEKPKDSWIIRYAPFWFLIPFKGKKKEPIDILPFAPESPDIKFNPEEILVINNIENTKELVKDALVDNIIEIVFIGKKGETVLDKEFNIDDSMNFTSREIKLIKNRAVAYIMDNSFATADEWESEIKKKYKLKNKF